MVEMCYSLQALMVEAPEHEGARIVPSTLQLEDLSSLWDSAAFFSPCDFQASGKRGMTAFASSGARLSKPGLEISLAKRELNKNYLTITDQKRVFCTCVPARIVSAQSAVLNRRYSLWAFVF